MHTCIQMRKIYLPYLENEYNKKSNTITILDVTLIKHLVEMVLLDASLVCVCPSVNLISMAHTQHVLLLLYNSILYYYIILLLLY